MQNARTPLYTFYQLPLHQLYSHLYIFTNSCSIPDLVDIRVYLLIINIINIINIII